MKKRTEFNIIIAGVGGQGLITLLKTLAQAAFLQGFDVKTSELHGLSQREGSVSAHLRFGQQIHSPLIQKGKADLILALEISEALRMSNFAHKETIFVVNKKQIPYLGGPAEKQVLIKLNKILKNAYFVEASKICQTKFNKEILAGVYILGYAAANNLISIKTNHILKAIEQTIPKKYFEINKKAFKLATQ